MFQAVKPKCEDHNKVHASERVLNAPVGSGSVCDPTDALNRCNLDAIETFLDDLDHFLRALDLVARIGHGCCDFVRVVVAEGLLNRLQVDDKSSPCVPVQRHSVEDQGMALVGCAQTNHHSLWLAQIK